MRELLKRLLRNINYFKMPGEHHFNEILREEAIKWACVLGESLCRETATIELTNNLQVYQEIRSFFNSSRNKFKIKE